MSPGYLQKPIHLMPSDSRFHAQRKTRPSWSRVGAFNVSRQLTNLDLNLGHMGFLALPPLDFIVGCALKEQRECFGKVLSCLGDRLSLACDIDLRAERDVAIALATDYRGKASVHLTPPIAKLPAGGTLETGKPGLVVPLPVWGSGAVFEGVEEVLGIHVPGVPASSEVTIRIR